MRLVAHASFSHPQACRLCCRSIVGCEPPVLATSAHTSVRLTGADHRLIHSGGTANSPSSTLLQGPIKSSAAALPSSSSSSSFLTTSELATETIRSCSPRHSPSPPPPGSPPSQAFLPPTARSPTSSKSSSTTRMPCKTRSSPWTPFSASSVTTAPNSATSFAQSLFAALRASHGFVLSMVRLIQTLTAGVCRSLISLTSPTAHNTNVTYVGPPGGGYGKFGELGMTKASLPVFLQEAGYATVRRLVLAPPDDSS